MCCSAPKRGTTASPALARTRIAVMAVTVPQTTIDDAFKKRFARSAELYQRSRNAIAGGITHDSRNFAPFPIYIERAEGARKWDVDGNELVDHWMGHGSLLLGHDYPQATAAV